MLRTLSCNPLRNSTSCAPSSWQRSFIVPRELRLSTFEEINPDVQERITFVIGNRYTALRDWLLAYREEEELPFDHFLRKLFGEVLSQPGFGFHTDFDAVRVASSLVDSVRHFRQSLESTYLYQEHNTRFPHLGQEYIQMLQDGVIAASYLEGWWTLNKEAVLVAPAYTFLMMNRPVTAQFWLDAGSSGWHQRLAQPLNSSLCLDARMGAGPRLDRYR